MHTSHSLHCNWLSDCTIKMRQILWVWMLFMMNIERHHCCLEEERIGLLEIKAWINHPNGSSLLNWVENIEDSDCCKWVGVKCDNTTNRVTKLDISDERQYWITLEDFYLNASLFLPFKELKSLGLGRNRLFGCLENQGFEVLASGLRKLEKLDLSGNRFNESILSSLHAFSSLKILDLSDNDLTTISTAINGLRELEELHIGANIFKDSVLASLNGISSLKPLDLSYTMNLTESTGINELFLDYSSLPTNFLPDIEALSTLKVLTLRKCELNSPLLVRGLLNMAKLEELSLDNNSLPTSFLRGIGALPALRVLSLQGCELNGILSDQGLCELKNLEQLSLFGNKLQGFLPPCLGNLSSLRILDLSDNQFEGNIAFSPLSHLTGLKGLSLSNNKFQVPVSFGSFMNHSHLKFVACDNNELIAASGFQPLALKFQLRVFSASNCTSKPLKAEFPNFLYSQYDLRVLDLSHNNFFKGLFPSWLVENNTRLNQLYLRDTSLIGPLQLSPHPAPNLQMLDISNNNIQDQIMRNTCLIHSNMEILKMANNNFTGCIPPCFANMSSLMILDLSNNHLSCEKLEHLPTFHSQLGSLKLSNNNFKGRIPASLFYNAPFMHLFLDGNKFEGRLSDNFSIGLSLEVLDLSNNLLSGMLPRVIGNSSDLGAIDLSKNHFEGTIPVEFFKSEALEFLDLSENNLSGSIPYGFNAPILRYVHLYGNQLSGPLTHAFYNSSLLVTLDLGDNNLTGSIPNWIDRLSELRILLLRANHFGGELPVQLCRLKKLSILDLSQNNFYGLLPSCLSNLNFTASDDKIFTITTSLTLILDIYEIMGFIGEHFKYIHSDSLVNAPGVEINFEILAEFTTKRNYYTYKGNILRYMSGMDLSSNKFTGEIPIELGNLTGIHALNLSHNNLTGPIPPSFSNLKQTESLDLSYNHLAGVIPMQFTELTNLEVFNVSYNNLSGKTPEFKNQFGTFDDSSYKGNRLLCGPPLQKSCSETESPSKRVPNDSNEDDGFIDMESFYVSFGVCYIIVVLTIAAVLCINPYWRRRWFYFIEECINTCYYFWAPNFLKLSNFRG